MLSRHVPDSGYSYYRTSAWGVEEPNAPDTLAALRTLRLLKVPFPEPQSTVSWLRTLQSDDGGFPTLTIGWATVVALAELSARPSRPLSAAWFAQCGKVLDTDEPTRDWADALHNAQHLVELSRLSDAGVDPEKVSLLVERARAPGGGWAGPGADLETTATALLVTATVGPAGPVGDDAEGLLRRCEDPVLGVRISPESGATSIGALWGGVTIAEHLGCGLRYRDEVETGLALAQRLDGGLGPRHLAISTLHDTWLGVEADHLLCHLKEE